MIPPPPPRADCVGIVPAGGLGARLEGRRPKAFALTDRGVTFLQRALITLGEVAGRLIVVAPGDCPLPFGPELPVEGLPAGSVLYRLADEEGGAGPLAGLVPALELAVEMDAACAWILAVDMPRVTPADLRRLAAPLVTRPAAVAVVARTARGLEPLCACVRPSAVAPAFRTVYGAGGRSPLRAFESLGRDGLVELDAGDPAAWPSGADALLSVNTPEDYRQVFGRALAWRAGGS